MKTDENTGSLIKVIRLPTPVFWALTLNCAFTLGLVVAAILATVQFHRETSAMEHQSAATTRSLKAVEKELDDLRHVISSRTAEDVIFLKILILNRNLDPDLARTIAKSVHKNAQLFRRDPDFVLAMIYVESNFDPVAVSSVGALGLMQVMPHWQDQLGVTEDLTDPETSIRYGLQIYGFYDQMYADTEIALQAYNRGPGMVDIDLMNGRDPARNGYAKKILDTWDQLKRMNIEVTEPHP